MLYCAEAPLWEQVPCVGSSSTLWVPIEGERTGETGPYRYIQKMQNDLLGQRGMETQ